MRLTAPKTNARVGDVEIRGVQRVLELEAIQTPADILDSINNRRSNPSSATQAVSASDLHAIQSRTAIVVPCKDESVDHIQGVWAAIPSSSLIILVSGSTSEAYVEERDALAAFCQLTGRSGMAVHQRDPAVAHALREVGMVGLLDEDGDGLVHKGKGEGLAIGIALAATARGPPGATTRCDGGYVHDSFDGGHSQGGYYKYIGFVDADNFVPGSVQEYCRAFSAGLHLAQADDAMVRISWGSKPKVKNGKLEFRRSGRSSEIVNRWMNRLLGEVKAKITAADGDGDDDDDDDNDNETDLICTGNAGEHAMTISLALKLRLASGYAIEPFHFLDMFERMAGDANAASRGGNSKPVAVFHAPPPSSPASTSPGSSPTTSPMDCVRDDSNKMPKLAPIFTTALPHMCCQLPSSIAATPDAAADSMTPPLSPAAAAAPAKVQILQIRTLNPHFHENKGEAHVVRMWQQGLSSIYHSPLARSLAQYRDELRAAIFNGGGCAADAPAGWQPDRCRVYPPAAGFDLPGLRAQLERGRSSLWCSGSELDELVSSSSAVEYKFESGLGSGLGYDAVGVCAASGQ